MRIRPILFNTDMVRAIQRKATPKTVTRRIIKGFIPRDATWGYSALTPKGRVSCRGTFADEYGEKFFRLPCQKGDILYVRETWQEWTGGYLYRAWPEGIHQAGKCSNMNWRPSIHMPKEAARIWLKVKDVRVERLQDITEEQAYHEGIMKGHDDYSGRDYWYYKEKQDYLTGKVWTDSARQCFLWGLWDSTLKKSDLALYDFNANPWVWVIEFERCEKPEAAGEEE